MDAAAWMNMPQGTVDLGLSPVLSHKSQSSHTLHSFSEPDAAVLPPSLDLSFTEPTWIPSGPAMYSSSQAVPSAVSGTHYVPGTAPVTYSFTDSSVGAVAPQPLYSPIYQPGNYPQGPYEYASPVADQRPASSYPATTYQRPLLPRTESVAVPSQPAYGPQRTLRPSVSTSQGSQASVSSVSTMPGHSQGTVLYSPASNVGHPVVHSPVSQRQPVGFHGSEDASRVDSAPHSQPVGPIGYLSDRTEDWSSFIQFDQEDTVVPSGTLRSEHLPRLSCTNVILIFRTAMPLDMAICQVTMSRCLTRT